MTERDRMDVDVLVVGAGPAGLAAAWTLAKKLGDRLAEHQVMVIEKGRAVGDHILSGAVMDPRGIADVFGADWREQGCPVEADVGRGAGPPAHGDEGEAAPVHPSAAQEPRQRHRRALERRRAG